METIGWLAQLDQYFSSSTGQYVMTLFLAAVIGFGILVVVFSVDWDEIGRDNEWKKYIFELDKADEAHRRKVEQMRQEAEIGILSRQARRAIRDETNQRIQYLAAANPYGARNRSDMNMLNRRVIEEQILGDPNTFVDDDEETVQHHINHR